MLTYKQTVIREENVYQVCKIIVNSEMGSDSEGFNSSKSILQPLTLNIQYLVEPDVECKMRYDENVILNSVSVV